jgi:homoserine kinase type II
MAVFTPLTREEVLALLENYRLGEMLEVKGITSGIENSNFFLDTAQGKFVLTVFERLQRSQLPFYLGLMQHLAQRGLPVPEPMVSTDGSLFTEARGKPVAIVSRLPGKAVELVNADQCARMGRLLARMHIEARDYPVFQPNLRGLGWWKDTAAALEPHLPDAVFNDLVEEVIFQDSIARRPDYERLPAGPIHADLFRDNVLFDGEEIGGVIDFYFAGCGPWLFDLAVTVNDWCVDLETGAFDRPRAMALLHAYNEVRPLQDAERLLWPAMLRAAALRFWISRLYDLHMPRPAHVLQPHNPDRFGRMLQLRMREDQPPWLAL